MDIEILKFSEIDLKDKFFDSLRASYETFDDWFQNKADDNQSAYVFRDERSGDVLDFLYLKEEEKEIDDVIPPLPYKKHLKVGTFKITPRHTRRGERFMKKIMDVAIVEKYDDIYVTIFPTDELQSLIKVFERYGFEKKGIKKHDNGTIENVYVKDLSSSKGDVLKDYPFVHLNGHDKWLLSIYPDYHTKLFPDSILKNENPYNLLQDVSETNSIHKIYICWMKDVWRMNRGDIVVIYRTNDGAGSAAYRSVTTSVCLVEEIRTFQDFDDVKDFVKYTNVYSVFSERDLRNWYRYKNNFTVVKMTYNVAFRKKVIRKTMLEEVHMDSSAYWGFFRLNDNQFKQIVKLGEADERYFVN